MKTRRITLAVLLFLTLLFVLDIRYFGGAQMFTQQPSIHFDVGPSSRDAAFEKRQTFTQSQGTFTTLVIKGQQGVMNLRSTDGDEIRVYATIGADSQEDLDLLDIKERVAGSELSYELTGEESEDLKEIVVNFVVDVPSGMEVSVEQNFGQVNVDGFVGFLNLEASFSQVRVDGLQGSATIYNSFGSIDLRQISGPITLHDSFSTSKIELLTIDGGYNFDIEVTNGSLKHNAGFKVDIGENRVGAHGNWGEGVHPVVIRSNFGSVTVNLDK